MRSARIDNHAVKRTSLAHDLVQCSNNSFLLRHVCGNRRKSAFKAFGYLLELFSWLCEVYRVYMLRAIDKTAFSYTKTYAAIGASDCDRSASSEGIAQMSLLAITLPAKVTCVWTWLGPAVPSKVPLVSPFLVDGISCEEVILVMIVYQCLVARRQM